MRGLPIILAYGALCTGVVAGASVLLPAAHPRQEASAAPMTTQRTAGDQAPNDMELQANRLTERAHLEALLADARPPVPMLPSPKPVFVPVETKVAEKPATATTAAGPAATAGVAATTASVPAGQVAVLRAPAAVARVVETDGYRGVRVVGREADGRWRAIALRGTTEVAVLVDDKGNVSSQ